jgi:uncharacterized cupin superfamily protein
MKNRFLTACAIVVALASLSFPGCRRKTQQKPPQWEAGLRKYPLDGESGRVKETESSFGTLYRDYYIRPRAYPNDAIDPKQRQRALSELQQMRVRQQRPHQPAGWSNGPREGGGSGPVGPGEGRPGTTGPNNCAWTSVGPTNINGRVTSIAIDPTNNQRIYVTTVGGIWRSTTGGRRWQRVSDDFLATVFGSIAVNPGSPSEVFAGSGDPNYHNAGAGIGIWRSTSSGDPASWSKVSPSDLDGQSIYKLIVDPSSPNDIYAASSNGVWKGTHSGTSVTWARVGGFNAWVSDLAIDFSATPRLLYAGVRDTNATSFGRGIWKYDGTSWNKRDGGIPTASGHNIAVALAPSSPGILYAKVENVVNGEMLGIYKTTTAGESASTPLCTTAWCNLAAASMVNDCAYHWYNNPIVVDPTDALKVYAGGIGLYRTTNGGTSWNNVGGGADATYTLGVHGDHHAIAYDPSNHNVVWVGNDGGVFRTSDTSATIWRWNDISHGMIVTEFYKITTQNATATTIAGGSQDNGIELSYGNRAWYQPAGCDASWVAFDSVNSNTLYTYQWCPGPVTSEFVNPVPYTVGGWSTISWASPPGVSPFPPLATDPSTAGAAITAGALAAGGQQVLHTGDGVNWTVANPSNPLPSGASLNFARISPSSSSTYYIGFGGGNIWSTSTSGSSWNTSPSGLPSGMSTNAVAIDRTNPQRAFAGFGGASGGAVYMTVNGGGNWSLLAGSGATAFPSSAPVTGVAIDPNDPNTLYVSTTVGVLKGQVAGAPPSATASWTPFDEGLPDGLDVNDIWVNDSAQVLYIGSVGHGTFQRDIRLGVTCSNVMLTVRDNVFDRGTVPSPSGVPDPEHPIPDPARAGFYKPDDTAAGRIYWWQSADIRVDVPSVDPPANAFPYGSGIPVVDNVEMQSCPVEVASCPAGTLLDSNPVRGQPARVYVQVSNQGIAASTGGARLIALYTDATTGLPPLPSNFWSATFPAGGGACGALDESTGWHLVDTANPCQTIDVINPELPEVRGFTWNVPMGQAAHSCVLVIVESPDDPLNPAIRSTPLLDPNTLVPNNRQISLRNLHVVDVGGPRTGSPSGTPPGGEPNGTIVINVPNPKDGQGPLELIVSTAGMGEKSELSLLPPEGVQLEGKYLRAVPAALSPEEKRALSTLARPPSVEYRLEGREAFVTDLPVPRGETLKLAIRYRVGVLRRNTAARFTVMTKQGERVLGGSTYVLRR